jgi:tetratricopeptide (TPR) repeat protein
LDTDDKTRDVGGPEGARPDTEPDASVEDKPAANKLGRFTLLERIGRGGMGVVYSAYDPQLDRRIAVKILRPDKRERQGDGPLRLLREAQAVAKISHPNVVQVFEVGTIGERVFMAMEFLPGLTLRRWLRQNTPSVSDIVAVMVEAGRGLAAAHAAGLVHRDFKPGNVLVGDDGRVRVLDFGLARAPGESTVSAPVQGSSDHGETSSGLFEAPLTESGIIMGTPAYMAPEQHTGQDADPLSDQYAFCVALYEALYSERPFAGGTRDALRKKVLLGRIPDPPKGKFVPGWLRKVVLRGMSRSADARYPDMDAILVELQRDPVRTRRRAATALGGAVVVLIGGLGVGYLSRPDESMCVPGDQRAARVWNEERSLRVRAQFEATGRPFAVDSFGSVDALLGDYVSRWASIYDETCALAADETTPGHDQLFKQMACLEGRLEQIDALATLLESADVRLVERAAWTTRALERPEACVSELTVPAQAALDPLAEERRRQLRAELAGARVLSEAGDFNAAEALLNDLLVRAKEESDHQAEAEALSLLGRGLMDRGDHDAAEDRLYESVAAAKRGSHPREEAWAWIMLTGLVGYDQGRPTEAHRLSELAEAALRLAPYHEDLEARRLQAEGNVFLGEAKYDDALRNYRDAKTMLEGEGSSRALDAAQMSGLVSIVLRRQGRYDDALEEAELGLRRLRTLLGDRHPNIARSLMALGNVHFVAGDLEPAQTAYEEALSIFRAGDENQKTVGQILQNLGELHRKAGAYGQSEQRFREALPILEATFGPDSPQTAGMLTGLAELLIATERIEEGLAMATRALDNKEKALGPKHPGLATTLQTIGFADRQLGRLDASLAHYGRAREIIADALGDEHPDMAGVLVGIGKTEIERDNLARAVENFEAALKLETVIAEKSTVGYSARFAMARALALQGKKDRAVSLAQEARDGYARAGERFADDVTQIEAWLAEHAG